MATLLDLTSQGDVATITDDAYLNRTLQLMDPQQLYALWERQHWQSQAIDLERDKEQWAELADDQKEEHLWGLSSFFVGEERVTTQFSGLVMAYEDEQEEAFLTTQQVDEARHMQFFDRWFREVAGNDGGISDRIARSRADVTDAFVELFDDHLVKMGERLIADPSDMDAKVDFVSAYHMVIEGTLALTGARFILRYLKEADRLPGFRDGFTHVNRDESRHVGFGIRFLNDAINTDPHYRDLIQETLTETIPTAVLAFSPGWVENRYDFDTPFGYHSSEMFEYAMRSLSKKLAAMGMSTEAIASPA